MPKVDRIIPRHRKIFSGKRVRLIYYRTPGGKLTLKIEKPLKDYPHCPCGAKLQGLPRAKELRFLNLSKKRVTRMYGGHLCSECARKAIRERIYSLFLGGESK